MHEQIQTGMLIARQISEWFQGRELLVELTGDILTHEGDIREQISAVRQKTIIKSFEETYFGSSSGQMITSSPDNELPSDYDPRKRPWYTSAVRLNRTVLTEPYRSAGTHGQVVTMAVPLYRNGQLRGVTGSDFRIDTVVTSMRQLETQGSGYAFLVNAKGMILVHPDNEWVGQSVAHLFSNQRITLTRAIRPIKIGKSLKYVNFIPVSGIPSETQWYVGIVVHEEAVYAGLWASLIETAIIAAIVIFAMLAVLWLVLTQLALKPLRRITGAMDRITEGDFGTDAIFINRSDEIGAMARAVEIFRGNGIRVAALTEAEERRSADDALARARMIDELQGAFGLVVDAASKGDFSRRVRNDFTDAKLNALAQSVNRLVDTIDCGLTETGDVLEALAMTDLTRRVQGSFQGAFGKLQQNTNAVADRLTSVVLRLRQTSSQLRTTTVDLLKGATGLAERASQQAAAVHRTSREIDELSLHVRQNADGAEQASQKAVGASRSAEDGSKVMAAATDAMNRINETSARVLTIVDVIDQISLKTTSVALNAAIEAARAGEAGYTFAVVAQEVRDLARNAARASGEVKDLICESLSEIVNGSSMVCEAGRELESMLQAIQQNNVLIKGIAVSNRRQSESIETIGADIHSIGALTQENDLLAQKFNYITTEAEKQAFQIDAIVDRFKLPTTYPVEWVMDRPVATVQQTSVC